MIELLLGISTAIAGEGMYQEIMDRKFRDQQRDNDLMEYEVYLLQCRAFGTPPLTFSIWIGPREAIRSEERRHKELMREIENASHRVASAIASQPREYSSLRW